MRSTTTINLVGVVTTVVVITVVRRQSRRYLTPLLGGYIADAYWGRYKTIGVFGTIYFIGVALMTLSAYPDDTTEWLFMVAFFGMVALGAGGIKSNVVTMGGDQFNLDIPEEVEQKER